MRVSVGGFGGPSYEVSASNGSLRRKVSAQGYADWAEQTIAIEPQRWEAFRSAMDDLGVWSWEDSYVDHGVLDGTSWSVEIEWGDRSISSSGSNACPPGWDGFCSAIEVLTGQTFR